MAAALLVALSDWPRSLAVMLAPRKKLWSSPEEAVRVGLELLCLGPEDVVYDLGCGDGRFVVEAARRARCRCVGVEVDAARAAEARERAVEAGVADLVTIRCENGLETSLDDATALYLYLVPRGLRLLAPRLLHRRLRVVSYMAPLPGLEHDERRCASPAHQPDAAWPLYYYDLSPG